MRADAPVKLITRSVWALVNCTFIYSQLQVVQVVLITL